MSQAKDTLLRLLALLRLIPHEPQRIATTALLEKLRDRGFSVDLRTVQRDLNRLSVPFSLICDTSTSPYRWSFTKNAPLDLKDMDAATALALHLAEGHLKSLLPQSVLDLLGPQFRKASNYLDGLGQNDLAHWTRRVRAVPNGKALIPAQVPTDIWSEVSNALLGRKQLRIDYLSRSKAAHKAMLLHPAGLVSRHAVGYLIASVDGYDDLRQFALHRILQAECLDEAAREHPDFEIDRYIRQDLNTAAPIEQVELIADVSLQIASLLSETPLSPEQSLEPLPDSDWQRLRARVPDDQETLWWVFGLGENVRVHEPQSWVQAIREKAARLGALYAQ